MAFCARITAATSSLTRFTQRLLQNLPMNPKQLVRQQQRKYSEKSGDGGNKTGSKGAPPKTYNTPHPPKDPPENYHPEALTHIAFDAPPFLPCAIFRPFTKCDEPLGPGASKDATYKNPEYFSYHRYSFVDIQSDVMQLRNERRANDNARCVYEAESDEEEDDDCSSDEEDQPPPSGKTLAMVFKDSPPQCDADPSATVGKGSKKKK